MREAIDKAPQNNNPTTSQSSEPVAANVSQRMETDDSAYQFKDNRSESNQLSQLQKLSNNSSNVRQLLSFQKMANDNLPVSRTKQLMAKTEQTSKAPFIQEKIRPESTQKVQNAPIQKKNNTGLPDDLKSGVENLSGHSMDDVKVHYNSDKPAQLNAHAYAQGTEIHLATGQEKHLPHEAWHVVQQKQGRVKPTLQMKGKVNINDDESLEKEADIMGAKSLQMKRQRVQLENERVKDRPSQTYLANAIQLRFNVELLLKDPEKRQKLFDAGLNVDDLEEVQELMEDIEEVDNYLKELETSMENWFKVKEHSHYKYTTALDMALFEQEKKWMVPGSKRLTSDEDKETIPASTGPEPSNEFLPRIQNAKPLEDLGAPVSHGEYAHRIQWYVISRSALDIGTIPPQLIRKLYSILGDIDFEAKIEDYTAKAIGNTWSLWGALVDVPNSATKDPDQGAPGVGDVGFSSPVKLTEHVSKGEGGLKYSQLQLAVLNGRIKHYFEPDLSAASKEVPIDKGRSDIKLSKMLKNLKVTMERGGCKPEQYNKVMNMLSGVDENFGNNKTHKPHPYNYDQRNRIAFGLCGIPSEV